MIIAHKDGVTEQEGWSCRAGAFVRLGKVGVFACLTVLVLALAVARPARAQIETSDCLGCHDDATLTTEGGRPIGFTADGFRKSVHGELDCTDCHTAEGDYEDVPHFNRYTPVNCADCHEDATHSFNVSFHAKARQSGNTMAPTCVDCHGVNRNAHMMRGLNTRTAENACRSCHKLEASAYDGGVHAAAAAAGKNSPGCISCHKMHSPDLPPAAGAVNVLCQTCHPGAMEQVERGGHTDLGGKLAGKLDCASCHDSHGTHKPVMSARVKQACADCHQDQIAAFKGSVHEDLLADGDMSCMSCHSTHKDEAEATRFDPGCGECHEDEEREYRSSVHRLGRLHGNEDAATCADCHEGHHVLAVSDTLSPINPHNIPNLCSKCHSKQTVITSDFVRLPLAVPNYLASVHGQGWENGNGKKKRTAVCTDCHGTHNLQHAHEPNSQINRVNLARTCGKCHEEISRQYMNSVHGRAVALGIEDSPTCTDCHDEHLIMRTNDPNAKVNPHDRAKALCGNCHTDPELRAKYGITEAVVETYLDSYHGWAVNRGSELAATCTDCHTVHEIRSVLDPASTVNPANVTETCRQCHEDSNPTFAQSYTHEGALQARGIHGWVRLIYIGLIIVVLGGMALHNTIVARYELRRHFEHRRSEPYVQRWRKTERFQHMVLLLTFIGLGITGFALRFPTSWWVKIIGLSGHEILRAYLHRGLALALVAGSIYHLIWVFATRRGRATVGEMRPRYWDVIHVVQNMAFHLGLRKERPAFPRFDYTQKAEYWAVVWGTWVMAVTGFVLWFPAAATEWLPAWTVRVSEVIHFYEAILAVSAIVIWHFFYVIFLPSEYPVSTIWLDGKMPAAEWKEVHRMEYERLGAGEIRHPEGAEVVKGDEGGNGPPEVENAEDSNKHGSTTSKETG